MRTTFPLLLLLVVASGAALLLGPAGFGPGGQSARATLLSEVKKLVASDAQADDDFGISVAADRDSPELGANVWDVGPPNGAIDGFDIVLVVAQFGHTCA